MGGLLESELTFFCPLTRRLPPTLTQGKVGVLTLSFARSYPKGSRGGETGFGPEIDRPVKAVARDIDPAHDFVTIRYQR